jgi:hypothetical protein
MAPSIRDVTNRPLMAWAFHDEQRRWLPRNEKGLASDRELDDGTHRATRLKVAGQPRWLRDNGADPSDWV